MPANSPAQAARLSRSAAACQRCRRRKQKCDLRVPQCSNCEAAQATCLSYHTGLRREIPRNYYQDLEAEVQRLKREVEALRGSPRHALNPETMVTEHASPSCESCTSVSTRTIQEQQDLVKSFALVVLDHSEEPRCLGTSSGVTLAKMVLGSVNCTPPQVSTAPREQANAPLVMSSLPPLEYALQLVDIYFQCRTPHFPLLERANILASVNNAYLVSDDHPEDLPKAQRRDLFMSFMIFSISLCGIHATNGGPQNYEGFFNSAMQYLDPTLRTDIEALRNILLVAQFVSLVPSKGNLWLLTGIALKISVDLGLHWETEEVLRINQVKLNDRRRLFWATYHFERLLVVTLGRPFGLEEQSVNVAFPVALDNDVSRDTQSVVNHLIRLARIDSEIKHVLYRRIRMASVAFPEPDLPTWLDDIEPRLHAWTTSIPSLSNLGPFSTYSSRSWWDATYNHTLLLLHMPTPRNPSPSAKSLSVCFDASSQLILCTRNLLRENKLGMLWVWAHRLFVAGLLFIYSIWNSEDLRKSNPPGHIINVAQACATTIAVLAERFPGAAGCRNTLEALVSATVNALLDPEKKAFLARDDARSAPPHCTQQTSEQTPSLVDPFQNVFSQLSEDMFGTYPGVEPSVTWPDMVDQFNFNVGIGTNEDQGSTWDPLNIDDQQFNSFME